MTVTFFGHRDTPYEIRPYLEEVLVDLIENHDAEFFLIGERGSFNRMVKITLQMLEPVYPHIIYHVVLAHFPEKEEDHIKMDFTHLTHPNPFEEVPKKYAAEKRNRYMIDEADIVVTYVSHSGGGTAWLKALAQKKGKWVIELYKG